MDLARHNSLSDAPVAKKATAIAGLSLLGLSYLVLAIFLRQKLPNYLTYK